MERYRTDLHRKRSWEERERRICRSILLQRLFMTLARLGLDKVRC